MMPWTVKIGLLWLLGCIGAFGIALLAKAGLELHWLFFLPIPGIALLVGGMVVMLWEGD